MKKYEYFIIKRTRGGNPYDPGATGNGQTEAVLTRELADMVQERLKKYATVYRYPKNRDAFADIQNGTFAKNMPLSFKNTHYVFEIHFNAFRKDEVKDGRKKGTECYVTSREAGITVEQEIMKNLSKYFPLRDNDNIFDGVKRTTFLVIITHLKTMEYPEHCWKHALLMMPMIWIHILRIKERLPMLS